MSLLNGKNATGHCQSDGDSSIAMKRGAEEFDFGGSEADGAIGQGGNAPPAAKFQRVQQFSCYAVYSRSAQPKSNAIRGQIQDFKHELHYVLTTIFDEKAAENLKSLSLVQLIKKAIIPQFRNFLRTKSVQLEKLFGVLNELSSNSSVFSLSSSCLLYLLARDQKSIPPSENCFRLISELLQQDSQRAIMDEEHKNHTETCVFGSFTMSALYAYSTKYLHLGDILSSALFCMLIVMLFAPYTPFVRSFMLWAGLAINSVFMLYNTQLIVERCRRGDNDYIWHIVLLFQDLANIFRYVLILLKDKKDAENKRRC